MGGARTILAPATAVVCSACFHSENGENSPPTPAGSNAVGRTEFVARIDPVSGINPLPNNLLYSGSTDGSSTITVSDTASVLVPRIVVTVLAGFSRVAPLTATFSSAIDRATLATQNVRLFDVTLATSSNRAPVDGRLADVKRERCSDKDFSVDFSVMKRNEKTLSVLPLRPITPSSRNVAAFSDEFLRGRGDERNANQDDRIAHLQRRGDHRHGHDRSGVT